MSSFSDLPTSHGGQQGQGFLKSLGKVFKKYPIASTVVSLVPGPAGNIGSKVLASQGLGKGKGKGKGRGKCKGKGKGGGQAGGRINLKQLAKAAAKAGLPLVKQSRIVSKTARRVPVVGKVAESLLRSQGFGGKGKGGRKQLI